MGAPSQDLFREEILDILYDAEEQKYKYPGATIHNVGKCLEQACKYHLGIDPHARPSLVELLKNPEIIKALGKLVEPAHVLREARNEVAHGTEEFGPDHAETALAAIKEILPKLGIDPTRDERTEPPSPNGRAAANRPKAAPSKGRIFPDWDTIDGWTGQMALTEGERFLLKRFDEQLSEDWRIFVQPYFLGLRPDIVLLNPKQQVVHIEVKDWCLDGLYWMEDGKLRDGRFAGRAQIRGNPISQTLLVRERFMEGPLAAWLEENQGAKALKSVLYFHAGSKAQALQLFAQKANELKISVVHREDVEHEGVYAFVYRTQKPFGGLKYQATLKSLEPYLGLPEFVREPLRAQPAQGRYCRTKWEKTQASLFADAGQAKQPAQLLERIRGGAGTGKSHILALRAARAARLDKKVLVTSYHITMANYLNGLVRKAATEPAERENILVRHYHGFLRDQQVAAGLVFDWDAEKPTDEQIVESLFAEEATCEDYKAPQFDAIYIDEGQDFDAQQIKALHRFLSPDGELVLVADGRQDVHGKFKLWTRLPVPFKGWRVLNGSSQRLPDYVARWLNFVAEENKVGDQADEPLIPSGGLFDGMEGRDFHPLWWADFETEVAAVEAVPCAIRLIQACFPGTHPADIVVLTQKRHIGRRIVGVVCRDFGQNTVKHVFGDNLVAERYGNDAAAVRKQKLAFHEADGRFKACTVHSFKGWEAQHVILLWTSAPAQTDEERAKSAALFYTGASRCRKSMVLLNVDPNFRRFKNEAWNDFLEAIGEQERAALRARVSEARPIESRPAQFDDYDPFDDV